MKRARALFDAKNGWRLPAGGFDGLDDFLAAARRSRHDVRCYADALDFAAERRADAARQRRLAELFPQGPDTPALRELLKLPLYPYQSAGALFAARGPGGHRRYDMGLGKTIQAIAAAEILRRYFGAQRVLVACPTSLKHQWREEIERLAGHHPTTANRAPIPGSRC